MAWHDLFRWGRKAANAYDLLRDLSFSRSRSGKTVNATTALQVSTVFGCARVIGHGMAQVPFKLMRETSDGKRATRLPATDHPLYKLMARRPNPWQTSYEFRETLSWHLELCGHAFVFVMRSVAMGGAVTELIVLDPSTVTVKQAADRTLTYEVRPASGSSQTFTEEMIWHLRGPSWNGWDGLDVLNAAREAIGLAMVLEESQASLHRNGVRSSGAWSVDGKLDAAQYKALREWIDKEHVGSANDGKPFVIDRGGKWESSAMSGVDAQTVETRMRQVEEVCRFFGVMPIMLGYSDKTATHASAESMFLAHAVHCLSPRWTRFEQSADAKLLSEKEIDEGYYFDFVEEGMIRGASKDTKDVIIGYVNGGVMTPNEGRAKLDMNPDPDPVSDQLRIPVTTVNDPNAMPAGGST